MKRMNKAQTERLQARIADAQTAKINKYKTSLGPRPELTDREQAEIFFHSATAEEHLQLLSKVSEGEHYCTTQRDFRAHPKVAKARAKVADRAKTWDAQVKNYRDAVGEEVEDLLDTLIFNGDAEEILAAIAKFEKS